MGKDVALALGYSDTSDALKKHVASEDKLTRRFADSGQNREMYIINESGLYSLVLSSKPTFSKRFPGLTLAFDNVLCYSYVGAAGQQRSALLDGGQLLVLRSSERRAAHEYIRSFRTLFGYHRYLQPVHSGKKEVTAGTLTKYGDHFKVLSKG